MSIENKRKDHIASHSGIKIVELATKPKSDDPLRFWTDHPTEKSLVDLHVFADGESDNPGNSPWSGPFSGRPELIAELAPAIKARLAFATQGTCRNYTFALRSFWRVFDRVEATTTPDGRSIPRLLSVRQLSPLHEAKAHAAAIDPTRFSQFVVIANDTRRMLRLAPLGWTVPTPSEPQRQLIADDQAKAIRIAIKRDWQKTLEVWGRNDLIRTGAGEELHDWDRPGEVAPKASDAALEQILRLNWQQFVRAQAKSGRLLPSPEQLLDGSTRGVLKYQQGIDTLTMRALAFPTVEEADIAFHMALVGCGWNPSTLITGIDATLPERVFQHPKDSKQSVLLVDDVEDVGEDLEEIAMRGSKRRAGGRLQFCMGLKKNPACPPNIVAAYLKRTEKLREQLRQDCAEAQVKLERLQTEGAVGEAIELQFRRVQTLQQGLRNVWLYVDPRGDINWIDGKVWARYRDGDASKKVSYLDRVIARLNSARAERGESNIARIVPNDIRDIYARWVHVQTGGNVIAVMHALGHSTLSSTNEYLTNSVFNAESDDSVRRFMTHFLEELEQGRMDLTILAQLVRHGPLTDEMHLRLSEYRKLLRSRVRVACTDARNPPAHIAPDHVEGKLCGTQFCLRHCENARFLPESIDGIAMRVEELMVASDHLPLATWINGGFEEELESGKFVLADLFPQADVDKARALWRQRIASGEHLVPEVGFMHPRGANERARG